LLLTHPQINARDSARKNQVSFGEYSRFPQAIDQILFRRGTLEAEKPQLEIGPTWAETASLGGISVRTLSSHHQVVMKDGASAYLGDRSQGVSGVVPRHNWFSRWRSRRAVVRSTVGIIMDR